MKEWRRKKAKKNNNKCTICFSTFHLALKCKETKKTHTPRFNAMFFFLSLGSFLVVFVTRVNYGDDVWFDALHIFMLGFARIENIICHRMLPKEIRDFKICIWFFFVSVGFLMNGMKATQRIGFLAFQRAQWRVNELSERMWMKIDRVNCVSAWMLASSKSPTITTFFVFYQL